MSPQDWWPEREILDNLDEAERAGGLRLIRCLVSRGLYRLSRKVEVRIEDGYFEIEDIECCILTGTVAKTEADEMHNSIGDKKYVIEGSDTHGNPFYAVGKLVASDNGKLYLVITARESEANYV